MIFDCPECGERLQGKQPGAIVACRHCANPVVVPAAPSAAVAPADEGPVPEAIEVPDPAKLWRTAILVVLILAGAHVVLYLLLTMGARAGLREIESEYTRAELEAAKLPDAAPEPGTPVYVTWSRSVALWDKAVEWRVHRRHVGLLRTGLLVSFLIQLAITLWVLFGLLRRAQRLRSALEAAA